MNDQAPPARYTTFKRSASDWQTFARARKITVARGLTHAQALAACEEFNRNRTAAQRRRGTRLEFERE